MTECVPIFVFIVVILFIPWQILNLNAKNMDERKAGKLAKALKKHKYRNLEYLL